MHVEMVGEVVGLMTEVWSADVRHRIYGCRKQHTRRGEKRKASEPKGADENGDFFTERKRSKNAQASVLANAGEESSFSLHRKWLLHHFCHLKSGDREAGKRGACAVGG